MMSKNNLTKSSFYFPEANRSPLEETFFERWNEVRESSVRGSVRVQTLAGARSHLLDCAKSVQDDGKIVFVKGSYRVADKFSERESDHIISGMRMLMTRAMKNHHIYKVGMLSTGVLIYDDDTFDVCDPGKGVMVDSTKTLKDISKVYTLYVIAISKKLADEAEAVVKNPTTEQ